MERTEAFRVLASADRQLLLHELVERGGAVPIDDLSRQVAARRHRVAPEKLSDEQLARARIRLIHVHFPELSERNVIHIDWSERTVELTTDASVTTLFEAAEELDSWPPNDLLANSSN